MSRKKKIVEAKCSHSDGWVFTKTAKGTKRTCKNKKCGYSVTEVAAGMFGQPIKPIVRSYHKKTESEKIPAIELPNV